MEVDEDDGDTKGGLFEWKDGPLVNAMLAGDVLLIDEISLADDSVIERLNSVLEPDRKIFLPERSDGGHEICAAKDFRLLSTMNPGGDFGKKELSPALRNRFLEIWCPAYDDKEDLISIAEYKLPEKARHLAPTLVEILTWLRTNCPQFSYISVRDVHTWCVFVGRAVDSGLAAESALVHGACLVFFDAMGMTNGLSGVYGVGNSSAGNIDEQKSMAVKYVRSVLPGCGEAALSWIRNGGDKEFGSAGEAFKVLSNSGDEPISFKEILSKSDSKFHFESSSVLANSFKVVRGLQIAKPVLLEGPPGVGKSALVSALAEACGVKLFR